MKGIINSKTILLNLRESFLWKPDWINEKLFNKHVWQLISSSIYLYYFIVTLWFIYQPVKVLLQKSCQMYSKLFHCMSTQRVIKCARDLISGFNIYFLRLTILWMIWKTLIYYSTRILFLPSFIMVPWSFAATIPSNFVFIIILKLLS